MPDGHRRAIPQVTAVDELFGTHTPAGQISAAVDTKLVTSLS
jgi:hypothetical protein